MDMLARSDESDRYQHIHRPAYPTRWSDESDFMGINLLVASQIYPKPIDGYAGSGRIYPTSTCVSIALHIASGHIGNGLGQNAFDKSLGRRFL